MDIEQVLARQHALPRYPTVMCNHPIHQYDTRDHVSPFVLFFLIRVHLSYLQVGSRDPATLWSEKLDADIRR